MRKIPAVIHVRKGLIQAIRDGWRDSAHFNLMATDSISKTFHPEYLITVNIAQALVRSNRYIAAPYYVVMEEPTKRFFNNCFTAMRMKREDGRIKTILRDRHNATRNGKIDIAIYDKNCAFGFAEMSSKWMIEVKKFNPSNFEIYKEIKRISEITELCDAIGSSSFDVGCISYGFNYSKQYKGDIVDVVKKCRDDINSKSFEFRNEISIKKDIYIISESTATCEDDAHEHHCFIGVTIIIRKKREPANRR